MRPTSQWPDPAQGPDLFWRFLWVLVEKEVPGSPWALGTVPGKPRHWVISADLPVIMAGAGARARAGPPGVGSNSFAPSGFHTQTPSPALQCTASDSPLPGAWGTGWGACSCVWGLLTEVSTGHVAGPRRGQRVRQCLPSQVAGGHLGTHGCSEYL